MLTLHLDEDEGPLTLCGTRSMVRGISSRSLGADTDWSNPGSVRRFATRKMRQGRHQPGTQDLKRLLGSPIDIRVGLGKLLRLNAKFC